MLPPEILVPPIDGIIELYINSKTSPALRFKSRYYIIDAAAKLLFDAIVVTATLLRIFSIIELEFAKILSGFKLPAFTKFDKLTLRKSSGHIDLGAGVIDVKVVDTGKWTSSLPTMSLTALNFKEWLSY